MSDILVKNWQETESKSLREAFGKAIVKLGKKYKNIVVLTADLASSTKVNEFAQKFPQRFFQVGVAEQNLIGIGAGLAITNKIPFCCSFATFLTGRAWEQIRVCAAINNFSIKLVGSHAGLSHSADGTTAQGTEDIAIMRSLPNMSVVYPADFNQMLSAVKAVYQHPGPVYLRMTREPTPVFIKKQTRFKFGQAQILKKGKDVTVVGAGPLLYEALLAIEKAKNKSIDCELVNLHTIKPIDSRTIINSLRKTGCLVTVEDHQIQAGLGSAAAEAVVKNYPVPMEMVGLNNKFGRTARNYQRLLKEYGLTSPFILQAIKKVFLRKNSAKKN